MRLKKAYCIVIITGLLLLTACKEKIPEYPGIVPTTEAPVIEGNYRYSIDDYIMSLDDKGITLLDFLLDMKNAVAMNGVEYTEAILSYMIDIYSDMLIIEQLAEQYKLELDEVEAEEVSAEVGELAAAENLPIIEAGLVLPFWERLYTNLYLYEKVGDRLLAETGYTFNEQDFQDKYNDFLQQSKSEYIKADFTYILLDDETSIKGILEKLKQGETLTDEFLQKYGTKVYKGFPYNYINLRYLDNLSIITAEEIDQLCELEEGEISSVIKTGEGYAIFCLEARVDMEEAELTEFYRGIYDDMQRMEVISAEFKERENEGRYVLNRNLLDNLDLNELIDNFDSHELFAGLE